MSDNFLALAKQRRTIYALGKALPVAEEEVIATIQEAIRQAPSAFNSQSSRALILLGNLVMFAKPEQLLLRRRLA